MQSAVLEAETFGSANGVDPNDKCVIDGICSKHGFWNTTVRGDGCVKR